MTRNDAIGALQTYANNMGSSIFTRRLSDPPFIPTEDWYKEAHELWRNGDNYDPAYLGIMDHRLDNMRRRLVEAKVKIDRWSFVTDHFYVNPKDIRWFVKQLDRESNSNYTVSEEDGIWGAFIVPCEFVEEGFLFAWSTQADRDEEARAKGRAFAYICIQMKEELIQMKRALE